MAENKTVESAASPWHFSLSDPPPTHTPPPGSARPRPAARRLLARWLAGGRGWQEPSARPRASGARPVKWPGAGRGREQGSRSRQSRAGVCVGGGGGGGGGGAVCAAAVASAPTPPFCLAAPGLPRTAGPRERGAARGGGSARDRCAAGEQGGRRGGLLLGRPGARRSAAKALLFLVAGTSVSGRHRKGHVCAFCWKWLKLGTVVGKGDFLREECCVQSCNIATCQGSFVYLCKYYFPILWLSRPYRVSSIPRPVDIMEKLAPERVV